MVIELLGVLENGTNQLDPHVPTNPRTTLTVPQGSTVTVVLTVQDPQGVTINLAAATAVKLTMKKRPQDQPPIIQLIGSAVPLRPNVVAFTIPIQATNRLEWGRYCYDIWMLGPDGAANQVMPVSPFVVAPASLLVT